MGGRIISVQNIRLALQKQNKSMISNKRGAYILEACIVFPPFIIAIIMLLSLIPVMAEWENAVYSACDELRSSDIRAHFYNDKLLGQVRLNDRLNKESHFIDPIQVTQYKYRHSDGKFKDLITVRIDASFSKRVPLAIRSLDMDMKIRSRAFTGASLDEDSDKDSFNKKEDSKEVYIFPESGRKYHNKSCKCLNPACEKVYITPSIKSRFKQCDICKKKGYKENQAVFCFFNSGEVYHRGDCPSVDKYYEKIQKREAISRGYSACSICGG